MESKSTKDKKFDSIYRAYKDSIFKVAMHYAKCEDLANEITQKTFFQLYIYFENVNLDNVYPWLVTTARNFTFNYNRDKKREILGEVFEVLKETKDKRQILQYKQYGRILFENRAKEKGRGVGR